MLALIAALAAPQDADKDDLKLRMGATMDSFEQGFKLVEGLLAGQ